MIYKQAEIQHWAENRGIYNYGSFVAQAKVLAEEVVETTEAFAWYKAENTAQSIKDLHKELGDIYVTWINACYMADIRPEAAIDTAVKVNSERTGNMINGRFVKDTKD